MAAIAIDPNPAPPTTQNPADETTVDNPSQQTTEEAEAQTVADEAENAALLSIRNTYKQSWAPKRQVLIRRVLKAFQYLKGDPYSVMNYGTQEMNPIAQVLSGTTSASDPGLYEYNDNVYQMLALSFMAALGPDVSKTRWMPGDPEDEGDLAFAKKASTMEAFIERMNDMPSKQLLKMLYMFCAGTYFVHTRNIVDAVRAGTTSKPVMAMKDTEIFPNRYLCPTCGTPNPENQYNPFVKPACFDCKTPLGAKDWYPAESMPMPVQVDEVEQPNSMTAIDIYCLLNVDVDPQAEELQDTPILDLEGELSVASVRARYPGRYKEITGGMYGDDTVSSPDDRAARELVSSPTTSRALLTSDTRGTFSRCWIQPWAFNSLEDEQMAQALLKKYPKGVKLVTFGPSLVLEKTEDALNQHWTEGRTIKGLGMNPFGVGDVALSLQDRVNDTANNIHIYQDRMALPPVLANAALINVDALGKHRWGGGRAIPVYPAMKGVGQRWTMSEAIWQPTFHADSQIYGYSQTLIMLMQLLTGIQPQVFGGGTQKGVETASGQDQQLNTAMGRLMLFLTSVRSEGARTAKLAVKAMASDIEDQARIVIEGETEGQYENMFILQSEVQGEIHAFAETDRGFPAGYEETRDRIMQILGMIEQNPILQNILSDPDTQKMIASYVLPDGMKLPGDAMRTKTKLVLQQLAKAAPQSVGGVVMPTIQPDQDFDDMTTIVTIAEQWAQENWQMASTNPNGYANVRAYFKLASQNQAIATAKQQAQIAMQAGPKGAAPSQGAQAA